MDLQGSFHSEAGLMPKEQVYKVVYDISYYGGLKPPLLSQTRGVHDQMVYALF